jgi:menaquinone-specific isochorismate synthase
VEVFSKKTNLDLRDVCQLIISELISLNEARSDHTMWRYEISSFDERTFFTAIHGTPRIAFKSRDRDFEFFGLGAADLIKTDTTQCHDALMQVVKKANSLFDEQCYFGAIRFDEESEIALEWQCFGKRLFILPMVWVSKINGHSVLGINYRNDGYLSWPAWRDGCLSLLAAIAQSSPTQESYLDFEVSYLRPFREEYFTTVERALDELSTDVCHKKVVIGRRRSVKIKNFVDPIEFFFRLKNASHSAFLFYLDDGGTSAFFGRSPELLYHRNHLDLETESLAGTKPRAKDESDDLKFRNALFNSFKEKQEHILVSMYIEEKLKDFGATNIYASELEIMVLPYVQHLVKRYRGTISPLIDDTHIVDILHPTPAVCGLSSDWALDFIRKHEGFDRGFYAGPIGLVSKNETEFAVAIRSALFYKQELFIYAASGIVPGSIFEQEWEELNNKEKNILSIF